MANRRRNLSQFQDIRAARINPAGLGGDIQGGRSIGDAVANKYAPAASAGAAKPPKAGKPAPKGRGGRASALRSAGPTMTQSDANAWRERTVRSVFSDANVMPVQAQATVMPARRSRSRSALRSTE